MQCHGKPIKPPVQRQYPYPADFLALSDQALDNCRNDKSRGPVELLDMKQLKVIVEKHPDGYVAYPLG